MAAPPQPPIVKEAPPPFFVEHLFFKSFPVLNLPHPSGREDLLHRSSQSLTCSSKYGVLLVAGQGQLTIIPAKELLLAQTQAGNSHQKGLDLGQVPYATVNHPSFGSPPVIVSISNGEEFLATDTIRGGVSFVLIFKLGEFLTPGSGCKPIVELRASSREGSKVVGIAWNPGENMNNMLAINCDDGTLQLASIKGVNNVEIGSYKDCVRSMSWSPKGKQLVIGKMDGSLCQLKLDLNEAKKIPSPPGGQRTSPSALFWASTTQFLVNYVIEDKDVDLIQLDSAKGAPLSYTKFGDVYVSDRVDSQAKCSFIPILPWNVIICASNTINDLVVIGKGLHEPGENWIVADFNDNRRAAIPIDSFAVGAALFTGFEGPVTFNETAESYEGMPVVFVLSESGKLASFVLVNAKPDAPPVFQKVSNALPPQLFLSSGGGDAPPQQQQFRMPEQLQTAAAPTSLQFGLSSNNTSIFGSPSSSATPAPAVNLPKPESGLNFTMPITTPGNFSFGMGGLNFNTTATSTTSSIMSTPSNTQLSQPTTSSIVQPMVSAKAVSVQPPPPQAVGVPQPQMNNNKQQPLFDMKSLPTTGLPSLQQVEDLKRIVEEKRAQGGFSEVQEDNSAAPAAAEDDEPDIEELLLEVEKFQKRLQLYNQRRAGTSEKAVQTFNELRKEHESDVLTHLNLMEDFVKTLKETKEIQSEEVNGIKERVIGHYTELEFAKALAERNKDPKYIQLLMAQPMDAGRAKKFCETEKLYQYIKNQTVECDRFYKFQNQDPMNSYQNSSALQGIYQTLANHSKVIRKLAHTVNLIRSQMGLAKTPGMEEIRVFEVPPMGHNYAYDNNKKPLLKERPTITIQKSNVPKIKAEKDDRITLDDLTAGLTRVQLNKLKEAEQVGRNGFPHPTHQYKPMKITAKKLDALTKVVSMVEDIEISGVDDKDYYDPFDLSVKNRARSRNLINKLDDKTVPPIVIKTEKDIPQEEIIKATPTLATIPQPPASVVLSSTPQPASVVVPISSSAAVKPPPQLVINMKPPQPSTSTPTTMAAVPATPPAWTVIPLTKSSIITTPAPSPPASQVSVVMKQPPPPTSTILSTPTPARSNSPAASAVIPPAKSSTITTPAVAPKSSPPLAFGGGSIVFSPSFVSSPKPALGTSSIFGAIPSAIPSATPFMSPPLPTTTPSPAAPLISTGGSITSFVTPTTTTSIKSSAPLTFGSIASSSESASPKLTPAPVAGVFGGGAVDGSIFGSLNTLPTAASTTLPSTTAPIFGAASPKPAFGTSSIFGALPSTISFMPPPPPTITTTAQLPATLISSSGGSITSSFVTPATAIKSTPTPQTTSNPPAPAFGSIIAPSPSSLFGSASPKLTSAPIFGGGTADGNIFGSNNTLAAASGAATTSPSIFGAASTTAPSIFGGASPKPAFGTSSIFGALPSTTSFMPSPLPTTTMAPSPQAPLISSGGPISSPFVAPATSPPPAFGSIVAPSSSLFGTASPKLTFGSPAPSTGIFGGGGAAAADGGSIFGGSNNNTLGASATSPSIFGAASPKPAFGSAPVFGSSPAFGSPGSFGASPAFGSGGGSTFGSAFGSTSPSAGVGDGGGSIFGGGSIQQSSPSFGALASQAAPPVQQQQQGFGSFGSPGGGSIFGGGGAAPMASSPFGGNLPSTGFAGQAASSPFGQLQQQQQQQPASASFGGSAFSSWR